MYPASAAFKAAIATDHVAVAKAEIWTSDQKLQEIAIESGTVSISTNSAIRRTCAIRLFTDRATTNLVPDDDFDLLTPFGNEIRLYRGVEYSDGTREYVPLGVFVITDVSISDTNDGVSIELQGSDRALIISRAKWLEPYQVVNGTLENAITALLKDRYADVQTSFPTTNVTINQVVLGLENNNDPWKDAVELCELVGYDLYFNANGVVEMAQFPTLDGSVVVATYSEDYGTTITALDREISTNETYNGVVYTIQGSEVDTPIRIEVWDEDTTSPTYRYGKFGQVPIFLESSLLSTEDEAITAASLLLSTYVGAQESISWEAIVDPTLDVQDVVYIKSNGSKVDRLVIIDNIEIPLDAQSGMMATARTVRVVATGETIRIGE